MTTTTTAKIFRLRKIAGLNHTISAISQTNTTMRDALNTADAWGESNKDAKQYTRNKKTY